MKENLLFYSFIKYSQKMILSTLDKERQKILNDYEKNLRPCRQCKYYDLRNT